MTGQPDLHELLRAVAEFLRDTAVPRLEGHGAFHARVAANVVDIVARELRIGPPAHARRRDGMRALLGRPDDDGAPLEALERELCERIARDELDLDTPGLVEHVWRSVLDTIAIDQPAYAAQDADAGVPQDGPETGARPDRSIDAPAASRAEPVPKDRP